MGITIERPVTAPTSRGLASGVRLVVAGPSLWRVIDGRGLVVGHLQEMTVNAQTRYRARRYHAPSRAFRDVGDFWSRDQAIECLRFVR